MSFWTVQRSKPSCAAGKDADDAIIREYAESTVAIADIKIAVRAQKTGKSLEFMKRAMAPCETLFCGFAEPVLQ